MWQHKKKNTPLDPATTLECRYPMDVNSDLGSCSRRAAQRRPSLTVTMSDALGTVASSPRAPAAAAAAACGDVAGQATSAAWWLGAMASPAAAACVGGGLLVRFALAAVVSYRAAGCLAGGCLAGATPIPTECFIPSARWDWRGMGGTRPSIFIFSNWAPLCFVCNPRLLATAARPPPPPPRSSPPLMPRWLANRAQGLGPWG